MREVQLAQRLGVSRIPIREALRTLQAEGLVVTEPYRGTICRPLEAKDLNDLYAVRTALEQLVVRVATERFVDLREFTAERQNEAARAMMQGDLARLIELDREFHAELAERSGNEHLIAALGSCWSQIMRGMHFYFTVKAYGDDIWSQHVALAQAIANGDADLGALRMDEHIGRSRAAILDGLRLQSE